MLVLAHSCPVLTVWLGSSRTSKRNSWVEHGFTVHTSLKKNSLKFFSQFFFCIINERYYSGPKCKICQTGLSWTRKKIIQASFLSFCDSLATSKTSIDLVSNKTKSIHALLGLLVKESFNGHHCNQLLRKINRYVVYNHQPLTDTLSIKSRQRHQFFARCNNISIRSNIIGRSRNIWFGSICYTSQLKSSSSKQCDKS